MSKLPYQYSFFVPMAQLDNIKRCILAVSSNHLINWAITPGDIEDAYNVTIYYSDPAVLRILGLYCAYLDIHQNAGKQKDYLLSIAPSEAPMCFPVSLAGENDTTIPLKRCIVFGCRNQVRTHGAAFCEKHAG